MNRTSALVVSLLIEWPCATSQVSLTAREVGAAEGQWSLRASNSDRKVLESRHYKFVAAPSPPPLSWIADNFGGAEKNRQ